MHFDLCQIESLVWLVGQHMEHQILEILVVGGAFLTLMHPPEGLVVEHCNLFVVVIVDCGLFEWQVTGNQDENDDAQREKISHDWLIFALEDYFWGHVA